MSKFKKFLHRFLIISFTFVFALTLAGRDWSFALQAATTPTPTPTPKPTLSVTTELSDSDGYSYGYPYYSYSSNGVTFFTTFSPGEPIEYNLTGSHLEKGVRVELYTITKDQLLTILINQDDGIRRFYQPETFTKIQSFDLPAPTPTTDPEVTPEILVTFPDTLNDGAYYARFTQLASQTVQDLTFIKTPLAAVAKEYEANQLLFWAQNLNNYHRVTDGLVSIYELENEVILLYSHELSDQGTAVLLNNPLADVALVESGGSFTLVPLSNSALLYNYDDYERHGEPSSARDWSPPAYSTKNYIFTDRPLYLPGDTVFFKGWQRENDNKIYRPRVGQTVTAKLGKSYYVCADDNNFIWRNSYTTSTNGAFDGQFVLAQDLEPGYYTLCLTTATGESERVMFQVEYYRKPDYTITATPSVTKVIRGETVPVKIQGNYFSGQPLAEATVEYTVTTGYYAYDASDSRTGKVELNTRGEGEIIIETENYDYTGSSKTFFVSVFYADATGNNTESNFRFTVYPSRYDLEKITDAYYVYADETLKAAFQVTAVNQAPVNNVTVEVSGEYTYYTTYDCSTKLYGQRTCWQDHEEKLSDHVLATDSQGKVNLDLLPPQPGNYTFTLKVNDGTHFTTRTFYFYVTDRTGAYPLDDTLRGDSLVKGLGLIPDREFYQPDETAQLTLTSNIPDRDVLITSERGRVLHYEVVRIPATQVQTPFTWQAMDMPNVWLGASSFSPARFETLSVETEISAERQKIDLAVTTDQQAYIPGDTATVKIQATDYQGDGAVTEVALWTIDKALYELAQDRTPEIFPEFWELATWNGTTTYHSYTDLMLHGNAAEMGGGCFAADTAITLADGSTKAIQDIVVGDQVLTRSDRDDITAGTQPGRVSAVMAHPNYVGLLTINDFLHVTGEHLIYLNGRFQEAARAQVGDSLSLADGTPLKITSLVWSLKEETVYNFTVAESHTYFADGVWVHNQKGDERSLFKDTAYWNPSIWTNADGQAQVQFVVPDNLTTWVLHAVAMNQQTQVGQTDSEIQVQRDVVVVPIMPDILRVNDEIQLGMLVRNHTATAQTITPGFEFAAGDIIQNPASTITIPALSTQEVWWRVKVTTEAEAADLHFWADGETERQSDNVRVSLPVLPFGKSEKTSTSFTQAGQTTINLPADVRQDKSSLEVVLSPSLMAKVQAGFNYTIGYPYGCVEQTCSGLSALLTAKANSNYFRSLKNYDQIDAYIEAGVAHLFDLRQDDGGWAYWSSRERAASFYTLYVLEQLVRAEALGYTLPTGWRGEATEALLDLIGVGVDTETQAKTFNAFFSDAEVMALYGLLLLDAEELVLFNPSTVTFSNYLDIEALNYAIRLAIDWQNQPLIDDLVRQLLDKTVGETTAQFWPAARTGSSAYQSQDSNTALSLQTLMLLPAASTHQSLIDATIEQLIAGQRRGYWANTYGTSRVSATLFDYVRTRGETAQQTYRVLLDGQLVRQGTFRDVLEVQTVDLPLAQVRPESVLTVETDAESNTLYWTLQQDLWRTATDLPAQTNSAYTLEKIYVDERHQHLGEPQVGDVVTVYLDLNNKTGSGLEEVVITDYLPSGWIALNANLDNFVGSSITSRSSYYAHQAFYPDRIEIAFRRLQPGHNVIAYQARVVTLAQAVLLPTSTEMMYQPEVVVNEPMRPQVVLAAKPSWAADFGWQNIGDDEQPTANTFSIPFISKDGSSDDQAFLIAIIIVGLAGIIIVGLDYARRKYPSRWAKLRQLWSKPTAETSLPETVEMGDEVVDVDEVEDPDEKEVSGVIKPRSQRRDEKHDEKKT